MEKQEFKFCTKCGTKMSKNVKFCTVCGAAFCDNNITESMPKKAEDTTGTRTNQVRDGNENIRNTGFGPEEIIIEKNIEYYKTWFAKIKNGKKSKINWASFWLSLYHAAYRNVWKEWFKETGVYFIISWGVLLIGSILCVTMMGATGVKIFIGGFVISAIMGIVYFVKQIIFSIKFNQIYYDHVEQKIKNGDIKTDLSISRIIIISAIVLVASICTGMAMGGAVPVAMLVTAAGMGADQEEMYTEMQLEEDFAVTTESEVINADLKTGTYIYDDGSSIYSRAIVSEDTTGLRIDISVMGYGGHEQGMASGYLKAVDNNEYSCIDENGSGSFILIQTEEGFAIASSPTVGTEMMFTNIDGNYMYESSKVEKTTEGNLAEEELLFDESEYILPYSDTRYLTEEDVAGLSEDEIRIALNEIYARHGRIFQSEDLNAHFSSKSWYEPKYSAEEFSAIESSIMNEYEKKNIEFLAEVRDGKSGSGQAFEENWMYGMYYLDLGEGGITAEIGYYTDSGEDYLSLSGSYLDSYGEFSGTITHLDDGTMLASNEFAESVRLEYNGKDQIEILSADNTGGMDFPGFEGVYQKTEDFPR